VTIVWNVRNVWLLRRSEVVLLSSWWVKVQTQAMKYNSRARVKWIYRWFNYRRNNICSFMRRWRTWFLSIKGNLRKHYFAGKWIWWMGCVFFQGFIGNKGGVFCKEEFRSIEMQTFEMTASDCANGLCFVYMPRSCWKNKLFDINGRGKWNHYWMRELERVSQLNLKVSCHKLVQ
jgi:hypothetical protein